MSITRPFLAAVLALVMAAVWAQTRPATSPAQGRPVVPPRPPAATSVTQWTYVPGPPELVAGPGVTHVEWSPDGAYSLALREKATMLGLEKVEKESSIVLWNAARKTGTVVWRVANPAYRVLQVAWMPGASVAFATVIIEDTDDARASYWRIDARRATAAELQGIGPKDSLYLSPARPYAVLTGSDEEGHYLRMLDAGGRVGPVVRPPDKAAIPYDWATDGTSFILGSVPPAEEITPDGDATMRFLLFHPATGEFTPGPVKPDFAQDIYKAEPTLPYRVDEVRTSLAGAAGQAAGIGLPREMLRDATVNSLWLVQGEGPAEERHLLAQNAEEWSASPRGDAVAYICPEGCFVVPLVRIDRAVLETAREKARRTMAMNNGKQIATAMMMYADDYDGVYPDAGSDVPTILSPYLRNKAALSSLTGPDDGFVYTFGGGEAMSIENPAQTEMGFIPAPGGRAVVYMDGHVEFLPDDR